MPKRFHSIQNTTQKLTIKDESQTCTPVYDQFRRQYFKLFKLYGFLTFCSPLSYVTCYRIFCSFRHRDIIKIIFGNKVYMCFLFQFPFRVQQTLSNLSLLLKVSRWLFLMHSSPALILATKTIKIKVWYLKYLDNYVCDNPAYLTKCLYEP